ncbi:KOW domain-containing RNA-binding protein [Natranaerobius trueperi]|uniref:KOW domain-containing RNA-binding protein n=1 Tax=Natranaerobius trueperi TaxID=759412 RepID=UPI00197C96D6|nr:KOW domain-containing RNA-binding protein [Natranaerobius trueperi]
MNKLQVGQLAVSTQGRDLGRYYLVIEILDEDFVRVSDGKKRPLSKPKKKNISHLQKINQQATEDLIHKLNVKRASDREVKEELNHLKEKINSDKLD